MMLSLKCHEQVQQSTFWMLHAKPSDEGGKKLWSQLIAKSQRKHVSCFVSQSEDLDSLKEALKGSEKSMFLRRRGKVEGCEGLCGEFSLGPRRLSFYRSERESSSKPGMFLGLDPLARHGEADKY